MKVVATSDIHGYLPKIEPCDLLIIGGDICPDYTSQGGRHYEQRVDTEGWRQQTWLDTKFREWLIQAPAEHIVGIAGNHDFVFGHHRHPTDLPWTYLEDDSTVVGGLRVYGTPWVPNLRFWAFYGDDRRLEARAEAIPADTDILVTHAPPFGYADKVSPRGFHSGSHVGETKLNSALERVKPKIVVCGHIHENCGIYAHPSEAAIYSVAYVDDLYEPHCKPRVIHMP